MRLRHGRNYELPILTQIYPSVDAGVPPESPQCFSETGAPVAPASRAGSMSRLDAPGRNVRQVCANDGATGIGVGSSAVAAATLALVEKSGHSRWKPSPNVRRPEPPGLRDMPRHRDAHRRPRQHEDHRGVHHRPDATAGGVDTPDPGQTAEGCEAQSKRPAGREKGRCRVKFKALMGATGATASPRGRTAPVTAHCPLPRPTQSPDRKSTRLNSSH